MSSYYIGRSTYQLYKSLLPLAEQAVKTGEPIEAPDIKGDRAASSQFYRALLSRAESEGGDFSDLKSLVTVRTTPFLSFAPKLNNRPSTLSPEKIVNMSTLVDIFLGPLPPSGTTIIPKFFLHNTSEAAIDNVHQAAAHYGWEVQSLTPLQHNSEGTTFNLIIKSSPAQRSASPHSRREDQ